MSLYFAKKAIYFCIWNGSISLYTVVLRGIDKYPRTVYNAHCTRTVYITNKSA